MTQHESMAFPRPSNCPSDSLTARYTQDVPCTQSRPYDYPSVAQKNTYGFALVATTHLGPGTPVEKFEGPIVPYEQCTTYDKCYVLVHLHQGTWQHLLPLSPARYSNHVRACLITLSLISFFFQ